MSVDALTTRRTLPEPTVLCPFDGFEKVFADLWKINGPFNVWKILAYH